MSDDEKIGLLALVLLLWLMRPRPRYVFDELPEPVTTGATVSFGVTEPGFEGTGIPKQEWPPV